ncbi:MAG: prepilin-type N-terminal cleavage/methylation domain-containing protein [Opitutales bacterium]
MPKKTTYPRKLKKTRSGFTLIELLMVFAVIAILAAITFGISRGVRDAQNRAKAKVELAAISQALEEFKGRYGDYPWHDSDEGSYPSSQIKPGESEAEKIETTSVMLLYALTGRMKFDPQVDQDPVYHVADSLDDDEVEKAPKFIDIEKFYYSVDSAGEDGNPGALLDPWGNPYIYLYKEEGATDDWEQFGYHLYSTGPDGEDANEAIKGKINEKGVLDDNFRDVADAEGIIFSGE